MPPREPFPALDELLASMGEAGSRTSAIELPLPAPSLAGHTVLVTGSGRWLRQIAGDPLANVGALRVHDGGRTGTLHTSHRRLFTALTSELNSHLAVHEDQVRRRGLRDHEIVLWRKHGVMARSDDSATRAVDRRDYAETGARCEYMDLVAGRHAGGLSPAETAGVAQAFAVDSPVVGASQSEGS